MSSSTPPSSAAEGSPSHPPSPGAMGGSMDFPRPSLARTSMSTATTGRTLGSGYTTVGWEQSDDIRGDLASGWGEDLSGRALRGSPTGRPVFRAPAAVGEDNDDNNDEEDEWGWRLRDKAVQPLPEFYPVDPRSTRRVVLAAGEGKADDDAESRSVQRTVEEVSLRISAACQKLSVHGLWDNGTPTATLSSMERVEMEVNMYLGDDDSSAPLTPLNSLESDEGRPSSPQVLLVELQRRKGCSVTFHNYRRCLLDAAEGKFDPDAFSERDGLEKPAGRDRCGQPKASVGRPALARPSPRSSPRSSPRPSTIARSSLDRPSLSPPGSPGAGGMPRPSLRCPSFSADDAARPIVGLKSAEGEGSVPSTPTPSEGTSNETIDKALKALTMAASLIRKDRMDAKRLGMESLVLLTDPHRAGRETAKIASRVVLLGTARDEGAWEATVSVPPPKTEEDDVDSLFDESAGLGIRETILEMIMADTESSDSKMTSDEDGFECIEREFTDSLFNLCLTVLSNALNTIDESGKAEAPPQQPPIQQQDDDRKPSPVPSPHSSPGGSSANRRRAATEPAPLSKRFLDGTRQSFGCDVLSSLIKVLAQARTNPHDAYHSARCLGVLFRGCGNAHKARARRDLDAKRIIAAALEVGSRSHAKLEDASRAAMMALVTDDEDDGEEPRGGGGQVEMEAPQQQEGPPSIVEAMSEDTSERL
ncbi:hypothetical protein ACHAXT_004013 [Thalassiosira profunda]